MRTLFAGLALLIAGPALAADSGWHYDATLYAWVPGSSMSVDTDYGTLDADKSGSDALNQLDMAFMGTFEARNGRWGFIGDVIYADITTTEDTPFGRLYRDAELDTTMTAFSAYVAYRAAESETLAFDVAAGYRAFWVDIDGTLNSAGRARDRSASASDSWVVPIVGARLRAQFSDKWYGTVLADAGGFSGDDSTWQALASVGYRFNPRWSAQLGYRYMGVEKEIDGFDAEMDLYGPLIGVTAQF